MVAVEYEDVGTGDFRLRGTEGKARIPFPCRGVLQAVEQVRAEVDEMKRREPNVAGEAFTQIKRRRCPRARGDTWCVDSRRRYDSQLSDSVKKRTCQPLRQSASASQ